MESTTAANQATDLVVDSLERLKGQNILRLDVAHLTAVTDTMVIVSGTSNRHVKSIANAVQVDAKEGGLTIAGVEGQEGGEWICIDMGDIVVHVMQEKARTFYQLEKLWDVDATDMPMAAVS